MTRRILTLILLHPLHFEGKGGRSYVEKTINTMLSHKVREWTKRSKNTSINIRTLKHTHTHTLIKEMSLLGTSQDEVIGQSV